MIPPLANFTFPKNQQNRFGAVRKYDIHTGIDLFTNIVEPVYAMTDSLVVQVGWFTGIDAVPESPWWNPTKYVICQTQYNNDILYFLYGEISTSLEVGQYLKAGDLIGNVLEVLKNNKGLPTSMLHFEVYKSLPERPLFWYHNQEKPVILMNPEPFISEALGLKYDNSHGFLSL